MGSEVSKENGCILDVYNIDERNFSVNYLFNMTKR